jgi:ATP-dependent DNA helicase DinG
LEIRWTKLPFPARNREEFGRGLTAWLGRVYYDLLPERGYEIREEQIYTAFRMARALADGETLLAEAGSGTGKTFAYLLPAVCYARFRGRPVLVASASGVLQAQLMDPQGDIQTLSRILDLQIDARLASDPVNYICKLKADRLFVDRPVKGWQALYNWARRTQVGARQEVPTVPDELWGHVAWDPSLPCDTCKHRGTCHTMVARRHYRAAGDLVVTDHRLFARDLLARAEREATGQMPLLPAYSAAVLDEGHHVPELWQRAQGFSLSAPRLKHTLDRIADYARLRAKTPALAPRYNRLEQAVVGAVQDTGRRFLEAVLAASDPGEGKRHVRRDGAVVTAADGLAESLEALQDELTTEETMNAGLDSEVTIRAYQARLDEMAEALNLFRSEQAVRWVEGEELWVVPRAPETLFGPERLHTGTPLLFSSATLEPDYLARVLQLPHPAISRVGVPFNLAAQVLIYQPPTAMDEVAGVAAVIRAMHGRTLVLLRSMAEVERYRHALTMAASAGGGPWPWRFLFEGDADRGAMLEAFRADRSSVLVGATFWEGVDVPGESLSCVVIPRLPFPEHDPLIRERRAQAADRGEDPFLAVDLPEMLLKLKQGAGRLIRSADDRGVLALLDQSHLDRHWAESVAAVLPEGAEATADLERVAGFIM